MKEHGRRRTKSSQSILDFVFIFIAIILLSIGFTRIWVWFNANFAKRQTAYQESRIISGQGNSYPNDYYGSETANEPIDIARTEDCPDCEYKPLDLTEEWTFSGTPSGTVSLPNLDADDTGLTAQECQEEAMANSPDDCGTSLEEFNSDCPYYLKCTCHSEIDPVAKQYKKQAKEMDKQAASLRESAEKMRDEAGDCDFWFIICWSDSSKKELEEGADQLDAMADELEDDADSLRNTANSLKDCCEEEDSQAQESCISLVEGESCKEMADELSEDWEEQISDLRSEKAELQETVDEIGDGTTSGVIYECNTQADEACGCDPQAEEGCYVYLWMDLGYASYEDCYEAKRNACCQEDTVGSTSDTWGRDCDSDTVSCRDEEKGASSPEQRCSLASLRDITKEEIEVIKAEIDVYQQMIDQIGSCCDIKDEDAECCDEDNKEEYDKSCCKKYSSDERGQCIGDVLSLSLDEGITACLDMENADDQIECLDNLTEGM